MKIVINKTRQMFLAIYGFHKRNESG